MHKVNHIRISYVAAGFLCALLALLGLFFYDSINNSWTTFFIYASPLTVGALYFLTRSTTNSHSFNVRRKVINKLTVPRHNGRLQNFDLDDNCYHKIVEDSSFYLTRLKYIRQEVTERNADLPYDKERFDLFLRLVDKRMQALNAFLEVKEALATK